MKQNTLKQLFFTPQGRINRQTYILAYICTTIAFYIAGILTIFITETLDKHNSFAFISELALFVFLQRF